MLKYLLPTASSELPINTESQALHWLVGSGGGGRLETKDPAHLDSAYITLRTEHSLPSRVTQPDGEELWPLKTSDPGMRISFCAKCSKLPASARTQVSPIFLLPAGR